MMGGSVSPAPRRSRAPPHPAASKSRPRRATAAAPRPRARATPHAPRHAAAAHAARAGTPTAGHWRARTRRPAPQKTCASPHRARRAAHRRTSAVRTDARVALRQPPHVPARVIAGYASCAMYASRSLPHSTSPRSCTASQLARSTASYSARGHFGMYTSVGRSRVYSPHWSAARTYFVLRRKCHA